MDVNQTKKKAIAEETWLLYFNQKLYEQGVISERDRNRMILKIKNRKPTKAAK